MPKNKISLSAWVVVACQDALSRSKRWGKLVPQESLPFYRQCLDYCRDRFPVCRVLGLLPDALKLWLVDRSLARGAPQHFALRKQAISKQVHSAIENGATQVVVLGGGFDLIAFHTARHFPQVTCFEIDTPEMHVHKIHLLHQCFGALPANLHIRGADLHDAPLHVTMAQIPAFDATKPTLFVAEGLSMYLDETDVKTLFDDLRKICKAPVTALFTAIEMQHRAPSGAGECFREMFLRRNNERFAWGIAQNKMPGFLVAHGFAQQYQIAYCELQKPLRPAHEMPVLQKQNGEYLVCAVANLPK